MLLSSYLEQHGLAISQSPGDGHCLLHAVTDSWHPQTNQPRLNLEQVKQHLLSQTLTETDKYLPFLPSPSREALIYGVRTYLKYKRYNQDFGDFFPRLLADSLKTKIVVLDERPDKHCIKHEFIPDVSPDHTIILHRKQDHYNALVPKSEACTLTSPSLHRVACRRPLQHLQDHGFPEVLQKQATNVNSIQYDRDTLLKLSLSEQSTLTRKLRKFLLRSGLWYNVKNASNTRNVTDIHNIATVSSSISVCITSYVNIQVEINKRFSDKLSPSTRFRGVNHNNLIRPILLM